MKTLYTKGDYSIQEFNKERFRVCYLNELVCKYDKTREDSKIMLEDLVEFMTEDGLIKDNERANTKSDIKKSIKEYIIQ